MTQIELASWSQIEQQGIGFLLNDGLILYILVD